MGKIQVIGGSSIKKAYRIIIYWGLAALLLTALIGELTGLANAQYQQLAVPLKWETVDKPGINGEIILAPSEINRIAASQDHVYAVDSINFRLHRSDNGGLTFTNITNTLINSDVPLPIYEIAVAPDGPQYVAVVTSDGTLDRTQVWASDDWGVTWYNTSITLATNTEKIQCITISSGYLSGVTLLHDVAIGTADFSGAGHIQTLQIGGSFSSGWQPQGSVLTNLIDVSAVAFSPKYKDDPTILATASNAGNTYLCIGARDLSAQTTTWNSATAVYPQPIPPTPEAVPPGGIISSISLPSDYDGSNAKTRLAFVGYSNPTVTGSSNVYRIDDDVSPPVQGLNATGGTFVNVSSIAYYGTLISGKLLAGYAESTGTNTAQVKWTLNPLGTGTISSTNWYIANQPPSGPGNAQVAWSYSGAVAFCGTGQYPLPPFPPGPLLDESAFSQSLDNGNTWAQTSLMNTNIHMTDIAPAPNSSSLFMATYSEHGPESVWRSAGEPLGTYWGRLLNMPTTTDRVILRLSPNYTTDYTLYAVEVDNSTTARNLTIPSSLLQISENRGNTWRKRFIPRPVIDVVTASRYTLYLATTAGCVRKSTDGGITWGDKVMTGLDNINMLALASNGDLFVGSWDSKVAYSTDNGTSFIKIETPLDINEGPVQVVPDADYSRNNIIYAADNVTDNGVWRWTIGQSTEWEQIDEVIIDAKSHQEISGLMTGPEGTLYVLRAEKPRPDRKSISDNNTSGMNRTLNPTGDPVINIEWDIVNRTLTDNQTAFNPAPLNFAGNGPWLKLSGDSGENDLWAIDTFHFPDDNTTAIYRFRDNLCKIGPWVTGPSEVGSDPVSGRNQQVDLAWEQLSLSDRYDLQIAKDSAFTLRINPKIANSDNVSAVTGSIHIKTDPVNVTSPALWLDPASLPEAGANYYWRVRTYHAATWEFIRSPWSKTDGFIVKPGYPVTTAYLGPQLLSPANGCDCAYNVPVSFTWSPSKETTTYKFEFSENADMSQPLISTTVGRPAYLYAGQLKNDTVYFWRVSATEPVPGDWSATFSFKAQPAQQPAQAPAQRRGAAPLWAWIVMAVGTVTIFVQVFILLRQQKIL